jgi:hypothetical protein
MSKAFNVMCDVVYDVTNDKTEDLLTAARRLVEAEKQIAAAKAQLHEALTTRKAFVDDVLVSLLPTI